MISRFTVDHILVIFYTLEIQYGGELRGRGTEREREFVMIVICCCLQV